MSPEQCTLTVTDTFCVCPTEGIIPTIAVYAPLANLLVSIATENENLSDAPEVIVPLLGLGGDNQSLPPWEYVGVPAIHVNVPPPIFVIVIGGELKGEHVCLLESILRDSNVGLSCITGSDSEVCDGDGDGTNVGDGVAVCVDVGICVTAHGSDDDGV